MAVEIALRNGLDAHFSIKIRRKNTSLILEIDPGKHRLLI